MKIKMSINGKDIEGYGLVATQGTLDILSKPAPFKKIAVNENAAEDGVFVFCAPSARKRDKQDISLPFLLRSGSIIDNKRNIERLEQELINGVADGGVNEIYVPLLESYYRVVYDGISKFAHFGLNGEVTITIKFIEIDPNNRAK